MALVRNWRIFKYGGIYGDIRKVCNKLKLKGCSKIRIKFDPFREDSQQVREFNYLILSYPALKSNPHLIVNTQVVCDRSEPTVNVELANGEVLLMKCSHLNVLDIFSILHEYATPLVKEETETFASKKLSKKKI